MSTEPRATFNITYSQGETGNGSIHVTGGGADSAPYPVLGRLDRVGDTVVVMEPVATSYGLLEIECTRTSSHTMRVLVRRDTDPDYGGVYFERVIEDVPLDFG